MERKYDSTVARIAGNLLSGIPIRCDDEFVNVGGERLLDEYEQWQVRGRWRLPAPSLLRRSAPRQRRPTPRYGRTTLSSQGDHSRHLSFVLVVFE